MKKTVFKYNTDGGNGNNREWTEKEIQIEGTISGKVKLLRKEDKAELVGHQGSIAKSKDVSPCTTRSLQLKGLRKESDDYLKEIGLSTSRTTCAPEARRRKRPSRSGKERKTKIPGE